MNLVLISDTHLVDDLSLLPQDSIPIIKKADLVIHCGDIVSLKAFAFFKSISKSFIAVQGNWDYELTALPLFEMLDVEGIRIGITHGHLNVGSYGKINGSISTYRSYNLFKQNLPEIIAYGHSHESSDFLYKNVRMINPGSLGEGQRSLAVIDIDEGEIKVKINYFNLMVS